MPLDVYKQGRTRVVLSDILRFAEPLLTSFRYVITTQEALVKKQGQADRDRYIRLMHLRDRFRTATSTVRQIPRLRRISSQTVINRLRQAGLQARRPVLHNVCTTQHLTERGAGRSSEVERSLMVRWVVGSILHRVDPLSNFSFQPALHATRM